MTQSEPDILRSELRKEAESLLNTAIELGAGGVRKQLLVRSFELIQRAEMISHLLEGSNQEPAPLPN